MFEVYHGANSFFILDEEGNTIAEMSYSHSTDEIIMINKTDVAEELAGKGVGLLLLDKLVDWARQEKIQVMPLCPYAKKQMENKEKYSDVLY